LRLFPNGHYGGTPPIAPVGGGIGESVLRAESGPIERQEQAGLRTYKAAAERLLPARSGAFNSVTVER
jgi:hypothetical protein